MKQFSYDAAFTSMDSQMSEWMKSKGLDALEALPKDFIVALLAKLDSHMRHLSLMSWP